MIMITREKPDGTTIEFEIPDKLLRELKMLAEFLNLRTDKLILKILEKYVMANRKSINTTFNMETVWLRK